MTACEPLCGPITGGAEPLPLPASTGRIWAIVPPLRRSAYPWYLPLSNRFTRDEKKSRINAGVTGGASGRSQLPAVRAVTGALRCIKSGVKIRRPVLPSLRSLSPSPCCHNEKTGVTLQKGAVDRQERGNRLLASPSKPSALGCPQKLRRNETKETIFSAGRWIREM